MSILIVGSVALDTVETPVARAEEALGGAATYASIAARTLHDHVSIVAVVGSDFPSEHMATLRNRGVDLSGLDTVEGRTFRWAGRYHEDMIGRDTLDTQLNVFADFHPEITGSGRDAQYVFLANIQPDLQLSVLDQVDHPDLVFLDTMNFWIDGAREQLVEAISRSDVFFLNDEEAMQLTGANTIHGAGERLLGMGPSHVVIKKGEHGANLYQEDGIFLCPAFPVDSVTDPTGAGDTFAGGCIGLIAATGDASQEGLRRAIAYGTTMASFCVEGMGTEGLLRADREKAEARYGALRQMAALPPALPSPPGRG